MKRLSGLTVLYLDDDPNLLRLVRAHLSSAGAKVQTFERSEEALAALRSGPLPHLILCDILIPQVDGHDFHRTVRDNPAWRSIPFIYISALDHYQEYRRSMNEGADGYLAKPFTRQQLFQEISHVLERSEFVTKSQPIDIKLLGTQQVRQGAELLSAPDRGAEAFVFYLIVQSPHGGTPRLEVIKQLWGDMTPSGFRSVLSRSRRWAAAWLDILHENDELRVVLKDTARCDLYALEAALAAGVGGQQLEELYSGALLPAYQEEWAVQRREELEEQVRNVFLDEAATAATPEERAAALQRALTVDPYDFPLWDRYISMLTQAGLRVEAEQARRQQRNFFG